MPDFKKILIQGYYGFENLGDDILMISTYQLVSQRFPDAEISIYSNANNNGYIYQLLGREVPLLNLASEAQFDLTVHGGGGVFFDFKEGSFKQKVLNSTINTIGKNQFSKLYPKLKKLGGKPEKISTKARLGLGLGIGTYTKSSPQYAHALPVIHSFNHLLVRDLESADNLKKLGYKGSLESATDLAFDTTHWLPELGAVEQKPHSIGFILRDWSFDDHKHIKHFKNVAEGLKASGFDLTFYSFCPPRDSFFIEHFGAENVVVWDPNTTTLKAYFESMASHQLMITSRAHGCIISACIGVPPICIEIEPKLRHFANMFPNGASLVAPDTSTAIILSLAKEQVASHSQLQQSLKTEVEANRTRMTTAIQNAFNQLES